MLREFEKLAEDIKYRSTGKKIVYIPNPGNWGDGLVRYGTKLFFEDFEIPHVEVNTKINPGFEWTKMSLFPFLMHNSYKDFFFIFGGGAAWSKTYNMGFSTVDLLSRYTNNILVLPSTFELCFSNSSIRFYSRGMYESLQAMPRASFCHDMAFYISVRQRSHFPQPYKSKDKLGLFLRTDEESVLDLRNLPTGSIDPSARGNHMSCGDSFLRIIGSYEMVFTDRLHVAIAAAMYKKPIHILGNSYFKVKEVYLSSLKERFQNVFFYNDVQKFIEMFNNFNYLESQK